jgi:hypothetical protein
LGFGVAASVITWFIYPMMERWIARAPEHIVNIAFVVIAIFGGILWSLYLVDPPASLTGEAEKIEGAVEQQEITDERSTALVGVITSTIALDEMQKQVSGDASLTEEQRQQALAKIGEAKAALAEVTGVLTADAAPAATAPATAPATAAPEAAAPETAAPEQAAPEQAAPEQLPAAA